MNLIAHRGLHSKNTKENTLPALILANKNSKLSGVELDVRLTRDNEVVVIHDEDIERVTNGKGLVRDMSLDRLKRFNCGTILKRERISTLDEVLSKLGSSGLIIIEIKDEYKNNDIISMKVLEIIKKYPGLNIWIKSFSKEIVEYLKKYSKYPVGILINNNNIESLSIDVDFYSISQKIINNDIAEKLLRKNKPIMIWTINSKEEIKELRNRLGDKLNSVYIISDYPFKIK